MEFTHGRKQMEKTVRGLLGFTVPEIRDSRDGRITLTVDADDFDAILMACEEMEKSGGRWDELLKAIYAYNEFKKAQAVVAAYEFPERAAAVQECMSRRAVPLIIKK
jgi:hypothetical protein